MIKSKKITLSILSVVGLGLCTGGVLSAWAVTDNAPVFSFGVYLDDSLPEGHYLYWNGASTGTLLNKQDLPNNKYQYQINIDDSMVGNNTTFTIKDQNDTVIVDQSTALKINLEGDYTLTTTNDGYTFTYPLYFTSPNSFTEGRAAFFFDSSDATVNDNWPGNTMTYVKDNDYGQKIYKIDVDAKKHARSSTNVIFNNNNNGKQTVDISLNGITAGQTGYYAGGDSTVSLETSGTSWSDANAIIVAYLWKEGSSTVPSVWEKLTKDGTKYTGTELYNSNYDSIIFMRYDPSTAPTGVKNNKKGSGWPGDSGQWGKIEKKQNYNGELAISYALSDYDNAYQTGLYRATSFDIDD